MFGVLYRVRDDHIRGWRLYDFCESLCEAERDEQFLLKDSSIRGRIFATKIVEVKAK